MNTCSMRSSGSRWPAYCLSSMSFFIAGRAKGGLLNKLHDLQGLCLEQVRLDIIAFTIRELDADAPAHEAALDGGLLDVSPGHTLRSFAPIDQAFAGNDENGPLQAQFAPDHSHCKRGNDDQHEDSAPFAFQAVLGNAEQSQKDQEPQHDHEGPGLARVIGEGGQGFPCNPCHPAILVMQQSLSWRLPRHHASGAVFFEKEVLSYVRLSASS